MREAVIFIEPRGTALEVVRAANAEGFEVIALTSDHQFIDNAPEPYRSAANLLKRRILVESWNDPGAVMQATDLLDKEYKINGIYSGMDSCAVVSALLRLKYNLPTTGPLNLDLILNKFKLRKKLVQLGLSKIKTFHGSEVDQWENWIIERPAYFKPVKGFFSAYVARCETLEELSEARRKWQTGLNGEKDFVKNYMNSVPEYHLEEAFDGELLSVESISQRGQLKVLGLLSRILFSENPVVEMGSCFPYPHSLAEKIIAKVEEVHRKLGFTDGPAHTELIVNDAGEIEIIDFNPRFVGADVLQSINHAYGIQIQESLLDYALGRPIRFEPKENNFSCLQYVLPPEPLEFQKIDFPIQPAVRFSTSLVTPGTKINSHERQLDYLGCYLTVTKEFEESLKLSHMLRDQVLINSKYKGAF